MRIENLSAPVNTVLPHVFYPDVIAAIKWLSRVFGFREHYRYGDSGVSGAQMHLGDAWVMLKKTSEARATPSELGAGTQSLTIFVGDVDQHFAKSKAEGARIIEELNETIYGERQYGVEDLAGHRWLFSQHATNRNPEEWGATVAEAIPSLDTAARPRFCYVEIPAADAPASARFYESVFGWEIRDPESKRPRFDDAAGYVSGAWATGREIARAPGLLPYIWVDDLRATVALVTAQGGEILKAPAADTPGGSSWIATFRDPAGNVMGLYQEDVQG
jgi:predicted enzyme related to lactoylglutathione lyase/uncharacterized glyoxalase superfamily protein PhnB